MDTCNFYNNLKTVNLYNTITVNYQKPNPVCKISTKSASKKASLHTVFDILDNYEKAVGNTTSNSTATSKHSNSPPSKRKKHEVKEELIEYEITEQADEYSPEALTNAPKVEYVPAEDDDDDVIEVITNNEVIKVGDLIDIEHCNLKVEYDAEIDIKPDLEVATVEEDMDLKDDIDLIEIKEEEDDFMVEVNEQEGDVQSAEIDNGIARQVVNYKPTINLRKKHTDENELNVIEIKSEAGENDVQGYIEVVEIDNGIARQMVNHKPTSILRKKQADVIDIKSETVEPAVHSISTLKRDEPQPGTSEQFEFIPVKGIKGHVNCKNNCLQFFSDYKRRVIFNHFWQHDYLQQSLYILSLIQEFEHLNPVFTLPYTNCDVKRVCRSFFLSTFGLPPSKLHSSTESYYI